jgi:uncharacterized membrane protein YcaP (DUF421 family)
MDYLLKVDWAEIFAPQLSLPEILVRGTVVYFALLTLLRILPKWEAGPGSIASMLFIIIIGDLAAEGVKGQADSVTDVLLMVATVAMWVIVVDRLSYHFKWFRFLVQDTPTCLIRDGRLLRGNLRRETMTEEDLKAQLRRQDVDDVAHVLEAYLEPDGSISVVKKEGHHPVTAAGATSPEEPCDAPEPARGADAGQQDNGLSPGRPDDASSNGDGQPDGSEGVPDDDPELRDFLAAAERLQARLEWHQEQVARFKEALTRHGVRFKPLAAGRREEGSPEEGTVADSPA